jgi:hypothetical protein
MSPTDNRRNVTTLPFMELQNWQVTTPS